MSTDTPVAVEAPATTTATPPVAPAAQPAATTEVAPRPDPMTLVHSPVDRIVTMIGADMRVQGPLIGRGGVAIKGVVDGDVLVEDDSDGHSGTIWITETGRVNGVVKARRIVVLGTVDAVVALNHLVLAQTARVTRGVWYECMRADPGAEVEGIMTRIRPGCDPLTEARRMTAPREEVSAT